MTVSVLDKRDAASRRSPRIVVLLVVLALTALALLLGQLLAPKQLRQMMTVTPNSSVAGYGLGLEQYQAPCGTAWGHGGSNGGYTTGVYATPDGNTVAVYAQTSPSGTVREQVLRDLVCIRPHR